MPRSLLRYGFLLTALVACLVLWFNKRNTSPQADDEEKIIIPDTKAHGSDALIAKLREPRKNTDVATPTPAADVASIAPSLTKECRKYFDDLNAIDLQSFLNTRAEEKLVLPDDSKCQQPPEAFAIATKILEETCKQYLQPDANQAKFPEAADHAKSDCYRGLLIYRSVIADQETGDLRPNEISDPRLLADKIIAKLFANPGDALAFSERLLELEPEFYPAAKISSFLQLPLVAGAPGDATIREQAFEVLNRAETIRPEDRDLYDGVRTALRMGSAGTPEQQLEEAKNIVKENPDSSEGVYMSSWIAFKEGRYQDASARLDAAIKKDPNDPRLHQTKKQLDAIIASGKTPDPTLKIYGFSVNMDPVELVP